MNKQTSLRKLHDFDAKQIAILHHQSFKEFFLTSLGSDFLEVFYKGVLRHEDSVAFGFFKEEKLIGFAVGTQTNTGFYKAVLKANLWGLIWAAMPQLLSLTKIKRLLSSFTSKADGNFTQTPILLSICIDKQQGSKGIGSTLLQAFEDYLLKMEHNLLILTTDANNNNHANQFYLNNNYNFVKSILQGKRKMNLYKKQLTI